MNSLLTNNSNIMISELTSQNNFKRYNFSPCSVEFFEKFYRLINESHNLISRMDISKHLLYYKFKFFKKPKDYVHILKNIRVVLENTLEHHYVFSFDDFCKKKINIYFTFTKKSLVSIPIMSQYIQKMLTWLYILCKYTTPCHHSNTLNIFVYFSDLEKTLPKNGKSIEKNHVNTGFTTTCNFNSEIVIYRKEEWFKVFLHETFHNFGLDFSMTDEKFTEKIIKCIFKVNVKVRLYEAYCEFWARIFNCLILSFYSSSDKTNYIYNASYLIDIERVFSFYQTVKILDNMDLTYNDMISECGEKRKKYKQETSMLSYYIICSIMLENFEKFLDHCSEHNIYDLLHIQFGKSKKNQVKFCLFINQYYDSINHIKNMETMKHILYKTKNTVLGNSMKKSIIEMA